MTALETMRLHGNALFVHDDAGDMVSTNEWQPRPPPALWIGFTAEGVTAKFGQAVAWPLRERVSRWVAQERPGNRRQWPRHGEAYADTFPERPAAAGPTCWQPTPGREPGTGVVRVTAGNAELLRGDALETWLPDVPHQQPMFVSLENGRAVSICASVRITDTAHEAGVETVPACRGRGHAAAAVSAWAWALHGDGVIPLYSTTWDNEASRRIAWRLGFEAFGWEYRVG